MGQGKPTAVVPWRLSRGGNTGQLSKGQPLHDAHLACSRAWPPGKPSLAGTRPPQEQIPPPEEILRQAGCKQQPGEGVEHVEGSSAEAREALRRRGWLRRGNCRKGTTAAGT